MQALHTGLLIHMDLSTHGQYSLSQRGPLRATRSRLCSLLSCRGRTLLEVHSMRDANEDLRTRLAEKQQALVCFATRRAMESVYTDMMLRVSQKLQIYTLLSHQGCVASAELLVGSFDAGTDLLRNHANTVPALQLPALQLCRRKARAL